MRLPFGSTPTATASFGAIKSFSLKAPPTVTDQTSMNSNPSRSPLMMAITILGMAEFSTRAQDAGTALQLAPGTHRIEILSPPQRAKTSELLIAFKPGTDVQAFARRRGLSIKRQLLSDPNMFVLKARSEVACGSKWNLRDGERDPRGLLQRPIGSGSKGLRAHDPFLRRAT